MHEIVIRRVKFSNILSYGNREHEVIFGDEGGLTWLKGPNGFGKSTIIEAITFAFFGSAYRKVRGSDTKPLPLKYLFNTSNSKVKLRVEVEFDRIDSKSTNRYIIKREMSKSGSTSVFIDLNGVEEPKTAGTTQKHIEEEILGFNKNIFENVISLNTIQTKPIIELDTASKRKLTESILTLSLDKFKDLNGKELKQAQTKFDAATSDVEKYGKDVVELEQIIVQMEKERADDIKELESELDILKNEVDEKTRLKVKVEEQLATITDKGKSKKKEITDLGDIDSRYAVLETAKVLIPQLQADREKLVNANIECDRVNAEYKRLSDEAMASGLDKIESELKEINEKIRTIPYAIASHESARNMNQARMEEITLRAKDLKAGVPCTTCGKPSTEDDVNVIKVKYRDEWKTFKAQVDASTAQLEQFNSELIELEKMKNEVTKKKESADALYTKVNEYLFTVQTTNFHQSSVESDISNKEHKIKLCGFDDVDAITDELTDLNEKKETLKILNEELQVLRVEAGRIKENFDGAVKNLGEVVTRYNAMKLKVESKKNMASQESLAATVKKLEGAKRDLITARGRVDKYSDKIAIAQFIAKMYADNGVKQIVMGIFMPNLNRAVAYNLNKFNLPYTIRFTDSMDLEFSSRFGMAEIYDGLSEGQKRKINYAVALSFRDFVSTIADFRINTLFLDEVLDISTDAEAFRDMVILTKEKMREIGHVFMITHRGELVEEMFDNVIEFYNDGRYSSLSQRKLTPTKTNF